MAKWIAAAVILAAISILIYQLQRSAKPEMAVRPPANTNNNSKSPEPAGRVDSSTGTAFNPANDESIQEQPSKKIYPLKLMSGLSPGWPKRKKIINMPNPYPL